MAPKLTTTTSLLNVCFLLFAVSFLTFAFSLSVLQHKMNADTADVTTQLPQNHPVDQGSQGHTQETDGGNRKGRRILIGSTAPICTYNECRGCKTRCRAEQVPVDANDPINSAYRYRCVCQRR
ncbi:EPIDERMAL PATTERNING FACTOR-like protein 9 [Nymphaea colorata]|nr:EPIDERMAL PATTERNING FACTOR-like protein 9 [Nymphaea colorata]